MAKDVIMPALGMAQETGTLMRWLKAPGEAIAKGEPLMEVETDKATVEIEAPAGGILAGVVAQPGDTIPVGQRIALILAPGEVAPPETAVATPSPVKQALRGRPSTPAAPVGTPKAAAVSATPTAARMAAEHQLDLAQIKAQGGRVQKDDVLAYLAAQQQSPVRGRELASPKARRLAQERGLDLKAIRGSGPEGAVLAADVLSGPHPPAPSPTPGRGGEQVPPAPSPTPGRGGEQAPLLPSVEDKRSTGGGLVGGWGDHQVAPTVSRLWSVMAERVSQAWTTIPHFYLLREVNAARLIAWHDEVRERVAAQQPDVAQDSTKITYTDLLVKVVAAALRRHPRLNVSWQNGALISHPDINLGLAVAVEDGLVVPVIHQADVLGLRQLAARRAQLLAKAQAGRLAPADLSGGTFTISNLGMYGIDTFNAIVNPPQAAILAVGRIAERVVPLHGQPAVQPMLTLSLSCDHRAVDGARGAQFLQTVANLIEHPMRLLE